VRKELGEGAEEKPCFFVFHGGSGSSEEEIKTAVGHGVVKMNVDTDTQWYVLTHIVYMYICIVAILSVESHMALWQLVAQGLVLLVVHNSCCATAVSVR
jgi:Fructose-bisphosphate aldolase class-II